MPSPQTVTIAQALNSSASALLVVDSAANIVAALPNAGLVSRVSSFTLSGAATLGAAAAEKLAVLGAKFHSGSFPLTVVDSVAAMNAAANAGGLALATSRQIVDAAYNLLSAPTASFAHISSVTLTGTPILSMAQLGKLESLPGFTVQAGSHLLLQDALTAYIPVLSAHPAWFASVTSLSVRLDGGQIGAAGVTALAALATSGKTVTFVAGLSDTTLNVTAAAHDLAVAAAALNQLGGQVGLHITVSNDGSAISAADAASLVGINGFQPSAHTLYVSDTGAAITAAAGSVFGQGFGEILVNSGNFTGTAAQLLDPSLHLGGGATVAMAGNATVGAAQAQAQGMMPGFALAPGAALTVSDSITNILADATGLGFATAIVANDAETVSAANLTILTLVSEAHAGHFSLGGNGLFVSDSAANLLALPAQAVSLATGFVLNADASVTAAQAQTLASRAGFSLGGHVLSVTDSAANLLALPQAVQSLSGHLVLAADQGVSAAQLTGLAGLGAVFSTGGHSLAVTDSAAAILALSPSATALASGYTLAANATVSEAGFVTLRDVLGVAGGGHSLTVADGAAGLLALSGNLALVAATALTADASVNAAQAQSLAALPNFSTGAHVLSVVDSAAALLALPQAVQALSGHLVLAADQSVSASQAAGLASLGNGFGTGGHVLTVSDSAAALLGLSPAALALAGVVALSANATLSAAQASVLAQEPGFTLAGHTLTIADNAGNLLGASQALQTLSGHLVLAADQSVSAAQLTGLAALGAVFGTGLHSLTVTDTAAAILALAPSAAALASGYTLSANATVSEADFLTLRDRLGVASGGHVITVADTAPDLLALTGSLALDNATSLTADATVSAAQAQALASLPGFATGGHVLTVSDSAAALLALPQSVQTLSGHLVLSADQSVSAAQATGLAALGAAFSTGSHALTVTDGAAALLALAPSATALASAYALNASATVLATQFAMLRDTLHVALDGNTLTIQDSAAHLLGLSGSLALASACVLSGAATVSAANAQILAADPGFSTGGYGLTISDNAANLLALSGPLQALAGTLALSAAQTVSVPQLAALTGLGIKFSTAGHALVVQGSATDLASLSAPELALVSGEMLSQSAVVNGATAQALVGLPGLSLGDGVTLTVQDNAATLLGLSAGVLAVASAEILPAGAVTLSASQAAGLLALGHFSASGATITVTDSVAALTSNANAGWSAIAAVTHVADSAANLAAASATALLQNASAVTLTGNATVTASQAAQLAGIPHYATGSFALTVSDGALAIVANEPAILAIATTAAVTDSGPVSAAQADTLALLSAAGKLVFQGGDQLVVADSYANLIAGGNSTGVALANTLTVIDTAANLVTASAHDWGSRLPTYVLAGNAVLTGAQATALAGLGVHFQTAGYTLSVQDNAANVLAASAALSSLGITATVADSAAAIGSHVAALLALGGALSGVHATDAQPVNGAVAAALAPLAAKLTGAALAVQDNAAGIDGHLAALQSLGAHVAMVVQDSAAAIGADAADLATLGSALTVSLTDNVPVLAAAAAALLPVSAQLAPGTTLAVTDSAAAVTSQAGALAQLSAALGVITLTGGNGVTVAQAAALVPLDGHLAAALAVSGNAASLDTNQAALLQLRSDGKLASVTDTGDSALDVAGHVAALNTLGAVVHVSDMQANVISEIGALGQVAGLAGITVTDVAQPIFAVSVAAYTADRAVLGLVTNVHTIAITDSAAAIAADLASPHSVITGIVGPLTIQTIGGAPVVLTEAVALSAPVADVLPDLIDPLRVTGVDVAHLGAVLALAPAAVTITDTAAHIQADLVSGSSVLLADISGIAGIAVTGGGTITLTAAQALAAGVDDGPGSVFGLLTGATLAVTQASTAQVAGLLALGVPPAAIAVTDSAAAITAALTNPASAIMTAPSAIVSLHVDDGQAVTLTQAQDLAAGVNDSAHAALTKLSGGALDVTGVSTAALASVEATPVVPTQIAVTDTGADVASALTALLGDLGNLGPITISSGSVVLTASQAMMAHVADGAGSLVSLLPGQAYAVAGATIAQVGALAGLAQPPASIAVTDTSAHLAADLSAGFSQWAAHVSSVTVLGGVLTLTDAQADFIGLNFIQRNANLGALTSGQTVDITGVPVGDLVALGGYAANLAGGVGLHLEVADTALDLANDLAQGSPALTQEAAYVNSVTLTAAGGTLTAAQLTAVAGIAGLNANAITVPVADGAAAIAGLGAGARALAASVAVTDSAANVSAQLGALQAAYDGHLTITLSGVSPSITVSAATFTADHATIESITNSACVVVTGNAAAIAAIEPALAADPHVAAVQVTDSAFNVVSNLSAIAALGAAATVTLNDAGSIDASVALSLVSAGLPNLNVGSLVVSDTGSQLAAMAESGAAGAAFLSTQGAVLSGDSSVTLVDASALAGLGFGIGFGLGGHVLNVWDTAAHLTQPGAAAALASLVASTMVTGIYLKTTGGAVTLTAATAATLLAIPGLSIDNPDNSANAITVADSAAHLDAAFATLQSDAASIAHLVVNASATIGATTLSDLQSLGAITGPGVSLTLSDSAASILAASAVVGASVQASAWVLNANANISSANAIALAGLSNFSPGAHVLTVALGNDTPVSVAQANNLAGLGAALVVTGHNFTVSGNVASLAGLSVAGASVAHVALTDTLADIAALSSSSPLLTGTITISDAEGLSALQATNFLGMITAAGINPGNISFAGHVETVTDTVAGLRALMASAAWTGNAALQSHFALVANDSASILSNPANAAFLDSLSGQVLSATSNVGASMAAQLASLSNFSLGGHGLIVSDSAANLLASGNAAGLSLATSITLNGAASLAASGAETLLQLGNFHLTQPLTVVDNSANLLDGTLSGLIAGHAQVHVTLAGPESLDAQTATALVALQGFSDTVDMHIVDSSSYLLAQSASAAEAMAASVSLDGNEVISANTVLRLSEVPHFVAGGGMMTLAGNDFANAATLQAIADQGANFSEGGHSLSLTQDDLALTPTEFAAIQADGFVANGHVISAVLVNTGVTDVGNVLSVSATGVAGASVNVYGANGSLISTTHEANASFVVTAPDTGAGGFSITETVGGVESAPVVVLDSGVLENAVALAASSFVNSGAIQVDSGKYINLYTAGTQLPNAPALVYDPNAHTISLDIPNTAPVTLITLGAGTTPASLDATEILVKHHS